MTLKSENILSAARYAQSKYGRWSDGKSISNAPELLVQSLMALKLSRSADIRVKLEAGVGDLLKTSGAELRGRLPRNKLGRLDLTFFEHDSQSPRTMIEIKKLGNWKDIKKDCRRLFQISNRLEGSEAFMVVYRFYPSPSDDPIQLAANVYGKLWRIDDIKWFETKAKNKNGRAGYVSVCCGQVVPK